MSILEFKKFSKKQGIIAGYYFEGHFLSRYKTEAIQILRDWIEQKGNKIGDKSKTAWEKGKEALPNVWEAIHHEWEKGNEKTRKTNEKVKVWRAGVRARKTPYKIALLEEEIIIYKMKMNEKMNDIKEFYEERIKMKEEQIKQLKLGEQI